MSAQPVRPRIIDPNMLPENVVESEGDVDFTTAEPSGLFTTMYENKMLVIIIVLVILIIGMLAYVVLKKSDTEEEAPPDVEKGRLGPNDNFTAGGAQNAQAVQANAQMTPQQANAQMTPQQANAQAQMQAQQMYAQQQAQMQAVQAQQAQQMYAQQQAQMQANAQAQQAQNNPPSAQNISHASVMNNHSKDDLKRMLEESQNASAHVQSAGVHAQNSPPQMNNMGNPSDDDISEYMKAAAVEETNFDDDAVKVMDSQTTPNDGSNGTCGAMTQNGNYCKNRAVVDGRCRKHLSD